MRPRPNPDPHGLAIASTRQARASLSLIVHRPGPTLILAHQRPRALLIPFPLGRWPTPPQKRAAASAARRALRNGIRELEADHAL